ncbi:mavicyanin-like [Olea europaea subsp. europaea]|uniref:Mavicyanin-like n=1 Tax=Olea europaea subsp. europaea TaxID=158383 RepID=A0A8S0V143_OLEEU|nr:mavicyanin-like [Olea europaea subsp. europaea]
MTIGNNQQHSQLELNQKHLKLHRFDGTGIFVIAQMVTSAEDSRIRFTYSVPQENIVELQSLDEFESCDLSNPIKMYTDGLNQIPLETEGNRYFVIGNQENCDNGLKLHVDVKPSETQPPPNPWPEPFPIFSPPTPEPKPFLPPPPEPKPIFPPPVPKPSPPPPSPPPPSPPPPKRSPPPPSPPPPSPPPASPPPPSPPPPKRSPPPPSPPPPKPSPPPPEPKPEPWPVPPSGSTQLNGLSFGLFVGFLLCSLGLSTGL